MSQPKMMERERKAIIVCNVADSHFLFLCLRTLTSPSALFVGLYYCCLFAYAIESVSYVWIGKQETLAKGLNDCLICMACVGVSLNV
jgi:hypothetical protein